MANYHHFSALTKKNYILWKRSPCCSVFEILLPFLLCGQLYIMRINIDKHDIQEQSYLVEDKNYNNYFTPQNYRLEHNNSQQVNSSQPWQPPPQYNWENRWSSIKGCHKNENSEWPKNRMGHVAMSPNNSITNWLEKSFQNMNYTVKYYDTLQDILNYVMSEKYLEDVCFGVSIDKVQDNQYSYSLLFNTTQIDEDSWMEVPDTLDDEEIAYKTENKEKFLDPWVYSGFLTLQQWIDFRLTRARFISLLVLLPNDFQPILKMKWLSFQRAIAELISVSLTNLLYNYFFLVLPLILPFLRLVHGLLIEKEKKIREGMKIMGMKNLAFYLSWILYYLLIFTFISLLVSFILNQSIYQKSDYTVLLIWHWTFCLSLIFQAIFVSAFFTRAKIGNIVAMIWFLANYISNYFLQKDTIPYSYKVLAALSSQIGMVFSSDVFLLIESEGEGVTWANLTQRAAKFDVVSGVGMTIANALVFMILSIYADQVVPNEFGKKKHPLFFILCFCSSRNKRAQVASDDENIKINSDVHSTNNIEQVDQTLKEQKQANQVLCLRNISKIYSNGKVAVNNLSLTMYSSQIFVLLGHNGAGKTTTLSMLTGMIEFTLGDAIAFGKNVNTQMSKIRQFMGVCPQHDILFDNLTVREHLNLFAVFKGMQSSKIEEAVEKAIQDVDLGEKADELAKNLSGGQKRRLSVAIAFIGESKLIYLDEPTSGMDTSARRHIWEMLKKYKHDKIVVLTTHFMDEADFLGDRIGIMGEGKLICCGSSVFLKNNFGVGYNLTVVKNDINADSTPIINYVKKKITTANVISNVSAEIAFQLPMESLKDFSNLFNGIDNHLQDLKIQSYGISITTLEEVFLRVAELRNNNNDQPQQLQIEQEQAKSQPTEEIEFNFNKSPQKISSDPDIDNFDLNSVRITGCSLFFIHVMALFVKRIHYFKRDLRGLICEVLLPCAVVVAGLFVLTIQFFLDSPPLVIDKHLFPQPIEAIYSGDAQFQNQFTPIFGQFDPHEFAFTYYATNNVIEWDVKHFQMREQNRKGSYYFSNISQVNNYEYYAVVQTTTKDVAPYFINRMNTAILRELSQKKESDISVRVYPFPLTLKTKKENAGVSGIIAAFVFAVGLSFIPASLITFVVKERSDNVKHQQLVSGVQLSSYWFANYAMDLLKHLIPASICFSMILVFDIKSFTGDSYLAVVLLFILYGWAIIPFSYVFSFVFADYGNAQIASFFIHFIMGSVGPLVIYILRLIDSTRSIGLLVGWILRAIPSFSFGYGILNISARETYSVFEKLTDVYDVYDMNIAGGDLLMMTIEGVFYYIVLFLIENVSHMSSCTQLFSSEKSIPYEPKLQDDDVQQEEDIINDSVPSDYTVFIKQLRKVFIPDQNRIKIAVDRVSFGIKNGECFTLLGVNGAGKTTTFKMLTGEINPTSGQAFIKGFNIQTQLQEARRQIGYCPQFDALLENLTAREHLQLYASVKGIPGHLHQQLIQKKLQEMDLLKFEGILAGTFSGGNKRKLSVAIAMLGNPPIVFLDEPSTGMDPEARRFMWNVISRISTKRKQSSIILTTHSMEEAEALSTKIAIQVDGRLRCLGSVQHIKTKFGEGYEVEIKIAAPSLEDIQNRAKSSQVELSKIQMSLLDMPTYLTKFNSDWLSDEINEKGFGSAIYLQIKQHGTIDTKNLIEFILIEESGLKLMQFIQQNLGAFEVIEHFQTFYRFKIEQKISIGKVFGTFEQNKAILNITQYSVKQPTIEQIFNLFAQGKINIVSQQKNKLNAYQRQISLVSTSTKKSPRNLQQQRSSILKLSTGQINKKNNLDNK